MATLDARYTINGMIRTDQPVWDNIEKLAEACSTWVAYDTYAGQYAVIINEAGNVVANWTENDIIGPIQISGSALTNLYNAVEIEYLKSELQDQVAYHLLELPGALRNQFEPDNTLQITNEFINNDVQAQLIANINLRQSRLDKVVTIVTDFTKTGRQAGDIITITSDTYGWVAKEFRIMRVREIEGDDGSLRLEFQCLEYDDSIYDEGDLSDFLSNGTPGIRSISSIGVPGTPVVVQTTLDSLPAQAVTTTVPAGIVERMQFWAGNVSVTGNVSNTAFNLIGTVASTDANSFTAGGNVVFTTTALKDGTWAWKARGVNALATGPFSNVSANVAYVRDQAPDVIKPGTPVVDASGNLLLPNTRLSWQGSVLDIIEYTGNSVPKATINTFDNAMIGINANISNIYNLPGQATYVVSDMSLEGVVLDSAANAFGDPKGVAIYWSVADWNQAAYTANGFAGLNWTDWAWITSVKDENDLLDGIDSFMNVNDGRSFAVGNSVSNLVLAFGYSTTIVPSSGDFTQQVDPVTGITSVTYVVGFSGNTVITDSTGNTPIYQTPGITAATTKFSGIPDAHGKLIITI